MRNVLLLGAGLVAKPLVRYLLDQQDIQVTIASRTLSKAEKLIEGHPKGKALQWVVEQDEELKKLIEDADIAISLLPYTYHTKVANICIDLKKPMVTTSYVSQAMIDLDSKAKQAGILILNEIGLDPGIDHMSAMKIIHNVKSKGGEIEGFFSYCGGLPAPEANTNPWGYKFSWNPRGVALAGKNTGKYLKDGKEVFIPGEELFANYSIINIEGLGDFEAYTNRDSIPYIEKYSINETKSMFRGTLRYQGWCDTWKKMVEIGFLDETVWDDIKGISFKDFMGRLISSNGDINKDLAAKLNIDESSDIMKRYEWLGLLSDEKIELEKGSPLDVLVHLLLEKLQYGEGERDMIILRHEFFCYYPEDGRREKIVSMLVDFGIPKGDTAMARTVSLPAAVGTKLMLEGKIKEKGVKIPVRPEIYEPVLLELENLDIKFKETALKM
jgi:saccharopine dehydrogenase (NADP+, L-glutamate forming)/spermidine synthase